MRATLYSHGRVAGVVSVLKSTQYEHEQLLKKKGWFRPTVRTTDHSTVRRVRTNPQQKVVKCLLKKDATTGTLADKDRQGFITRFQKEQRKINSPPVQN